MPASQTRKQREIAERHALFLNTARTLLQEGGFHSLSMERVADVAEYSKGTVYQHFTCKEELLIQLCHEGMTELLRLFRKASDFNGTHRDRLLAVFFANELWARVDPIHVYLMQYLESGDTKDRVTASSLAQHDVLEQQILGSVSSIVQDAHDAGDLPPSSLNPIEVVFGLWSQCHGGQLLQSYDIPLEEFGVRQPVRVLLRMSSATLDGLGWQPLYQSTELAATLDQFINELFPEELIAMGSQSSNLLSAIGGQP